MPRYAVLLLLLVTPPSLCGDDERASDPPVATGRFVYKQEPRRTLTVYYPDDWKADDRRPALIIFRCNIPYHREHFRKLGMVVIEPQLAAVNSGRLPSLSLQEIAKQPKPRDQVADTKSAIRFIRSHADELGVDPNRLVATGTSGGGDLALQSYINTAFEDPEDDRAVSHQPNALVLYCPAFDGIDIWFVKTETLIQRTKDGAPAFFPLLAEVVGDMTGDYVVPLDHRATLIEKAATLGAQKAITKAEITAFQKVLELFNQRDWQLLHPVEDALRMSASRILDEKPLPPTLLMYGDRDHLVQYQEAFVTKARALGKTLTVRIYEGGGHSFMMQPAFMEPSTREAEAFLKSLNYLPVEVR